MIEMRVGRVEWVGGRVGDGWSSGFGRGKGGGGLRTVGCEAA